ncbi:hypothetical protein CGCF415_v015173 [Colletotrichum fructicola]|nr:uncharacterized protein CGMCC3_g15603 [Colletotrichum fructicola]KAE9568331.1 hypothetical protein CGMCC3_g15603 [Colletotrichum fructicola]KAF4881950.1 hypothetical protein CGCFRS4_v015047 [Colletotrichum fructicola]KAF4886275.1 hypothetical protein CGCF415_v015173 [Colletotrichum fructicola]KAF4923125.1 hypothetical protein CGCF245_v015071 [Colletotrichum fructicola]
MLEGSRHGLPWDHEIRRGHWAKTSSRANPRTDARFPSSTFNKTISGCLQREPAKRGGGGLTPGSSSEGVSDRLQASSSERLASYCTTAHQTWALNYPLPVPQGFPVDAAMGRGRDTWGSCCRRGEGKGRIRKKRR